MPNTHLELEANFDELWTESFVGKLLVYMFRENSSVYSTRVVRELFEISNARQTELMDPR